MIMLTSLLWLCPVPASGQLIRGAPEVIGWCCWNAAEEPMASSPLLSDAGAALVLGVALLQQVPC